MHMRYFLHIIITVAIDPAVDGKSTASKAGPRRIIIKYLVNHAYTHGEFDL